MSMTTKRAKCPACESVGIRTLPMHRWKHIHCDGLGQALLMCQQCVTELVTLIHLDGLTAENFARSVADSHVPAKPAQVEEIDPNWTEREKKNA